VTIYYTLSFSGGREESHRLLRDAIAEYTGDREKAEALAGELKTGENGKPFIEGFDHFSISHSGEAWAVLFHETECGLDIQYERKSDVSTLARRWYNPIDAKAVGEAMKISEGSGVKEFFDLWTRREALIKALGSSVCDTSLPPVGGDEVSTGSGEYVIRDIVIGGEKELHAAICIRKEEYKDCDGGSGCLSGEPDAHRL
jgi:hypothetical protein